MTYYVGNHFSSFKTILYLHLINDGVMEYNMSNRHIYWCFRTWIMHLDKSVSKLENQVLKISMQSFMCSFIVMMLTHQCSVNIFWMIHINKLFNMFYKPFFKPPQSSMMVFNKFFHHMFEWFSFVCVFFTKFHVKSQFIANLVICQPFHLWRKGLVQFSTWNLNTNYIHEE